MADDRDPASLIDAAQRAAAVADFVAAGRLLREAADLQEAALGPSHPDLATTLNNLAFVDERSGNVEQAERGYRRAHAIAVASLSPGHPFIKTSLANLMEFCESRGIPIWIRPETPTEDEPLPDEADVEPPSIEIPADVVAETAVVTEAAVASRFPLRMVAVAALVVVAIAVVVLATQGQGTTKNESPRTAPASSPGPGPVAGPVPGPVTSVAPSPVPRPGHSPAPGTERQSVTVLKAQLCKALEKRGSPDWQCTPVAGDQRPGTFVFYTRLLAREGTRVEHRWYFAGRVHQVMRLRVPPNGSAGYRTFSSNRVIKERAGDWKVELRADDGTVLDEARFVVR